MIYILNKFQVHTSFLFLMIVLSDFVKLKIRMLAGLDIRILIRYCGVYSIKLI